VTIFRRGPAIRRLCTARICGESSHSAEDNAINCVSPTAPSPRFYAPTHDFSSDRSPSTMHTECCLSTKSRLGSTQEESSFSGVLPFGDHHRSRMLSPSEEALGGEKLEQFQPGETLVPLQCNAPHSNYLVPPDMVLRFVDSARASCPSTVEEWLRCAVWWLLKVKASSILPRRDGF